MFFANYHRINYLCSALKFCVLVILIQSQNTASWTLKLYVIFIKNYQIKDPVHFLPRGTVICPVMFLNFLFFYFEATLQCSLTLFTREGANFPSLSFFVINAFKNKLFSSNQLDFESNLFTVGEMELLELWKVSQF